MPKEIDTYYEPFCGGCSVLFRLLQTASVHVEHFVASDLNADLISLWKTIKETPEEVSAGYASLWEEFNKVTKGQSVFERRKAVFQEVRDRYNKSHSPIDFLFLMRTAINGMPRYNKSGKFNSACHFTRPGIAPGSLARICAGWSALLNEKDVLFLSRDFAEIKPEGCNDFIYVDPPYMNTHGMYFGAINQNRLFDWLRGLKCSWIMSFDGRTSTKDYTCEVPADIYTLHAYLESGNSSFRRLKGTDRKALVEESLYLKR